MMWLRAGSRFDRGWCLWWAAEYLNTSLIILSGAHELMPEETSSLCSKLYVVPIFYSFFFYQICTYFKQTFIEKNIRAGEQHGWNLNNICKVLIRGTFLVVYAAESSYSTKHCCSKQVFIQIPASQKQKQTIDMTEYSGRKSSVSTKESGKAVSLYRPCCTSRSVEETWIALNDDCPNLGPGAESRQLWRGLRDCKH